MAFEEVMQISDKTHNKEGKKERKRREMATVLGVLIYGCGLACTEKNMERREKFTDTD